MWVGAVEGPRKGQSPVAHRRDRIEGGSLFETAALQYRAANKNLLMWAIGLRRTARQPPGIMAVFSTVEKSAKTSLLSQRRGLGVGGGVRPLWENLALQGVVYHSLFATQRVRCWLG
jgi:hypothetical protein